MTMYCLIHLHALDSTVGQTTDAYKAKEFAQSNCNGKQCHEVYEMPAKWQRPGWANRLRVDYALTQRLIGEIISQGKRLTLRDIQIAMDDVREGLSKKDAADFKFLGDALKLDPGATLSQRRAMKAYMRLCALAGVDPTRL